MFQELGAARRLISFLHMLPNHAANNERGRRRGALLMGRQRMPVAASPDHTSRGDDGIPAMRGHHATYEQAPLPIGVTLVAMMMVLILAFFAVAPDEEPRLGGCPYINVM